MRSTTYKNNYKKEHYIRKEILFKKEEWIEINKFLENNNTTLKNIILENIKKRNK